MVLKSSLPPKTDWLLDPCRWPHLNAVHPAFVSTLPHLYELLRKLFVRTLSTTPQSLAVFGVGRMCIEDLIEIVFMVEHGFHLAGLKLLRGLYERAITAEVISASSTDADLFYNYHAVSAHKANQRAKQVYKAEWAPKNIKENVEDWYESVKAKYNMERCPTCGLRGQLGWSPDGLEGLADKVAKIFANRHGQRKQPHYRNLYLICAEMTNPHIHASMNSIFSRLQQDGDDLAFKGGFVEEGVMALSTAHALMSLVVDTQNRFFNLGLEDDLQRMYIDSMTAWDGTRSHPELLQE